MLGLSLHKFEPIGVSVEGLWWIREVNWLPINSQFSSMRNIIHFGNKYFEFRLVLKRSISEYLDLHCCRDVVSVIEGPGYVQLLNEVTVVESSCRYVMLDRL